MRISALLPLLASTAALILSFLCLFAGHKKGFMESYDLLTLNTSQIGENLVNGTLTDGSNSIESWLNSIGDDIAGDINDAVNSIAQEVGLQDWYSAHILDYCDGTYTPTSAANATISSSEIHKNISSCSKAKGMFHFNATEVLQKSLNDSGVDITLSDLNWPQDIEDALNAVKVAYYAMFILYCTSIGLIFLSLFGALFAIFTVGRLAAALNILVTLLAFLSIGIASAIATAVIVKACDAINKYGNDIGVEAQRGHKFMAITWAATGLMFIAILWWCGECCIGHRRRAPKVHSLDKSG